MKIKKTRNLVTACAFLGIILTLTIINYSGLKNIFREKLNNYTLDSLQDSATQVEDSYRTSFKSRDRFINIYGVTQLILDKTMIGNFELLKDKQGFMHMFNSDIDTSRFNEDMLEMKKLLKEKNIPLLYVQIPSREIKNYTEFSSNILVDTNIAMDSVINNLKKNEINYLDIRENIANNEYPKDEIYLKTDIHMKTGTEFWILQKIIENLESEFDLKFKNKNEIFDKNNYIIENKKMLGNLGRSGGKYFTGLDDFELYYPNFSSNFNVSNYTSGIVRSGEFRDSVMNGLKSNDYRSYWVTNYLQWPSPYYNIENKNIDKNNILIIMDSLGLRTAAYLSLLCNNVTILDSRYFNGVNYFENALTKKQYDAIIILQSSNLLYSKLLPKGLQAEIISDNTPKQIENGKKYDVSITVKNTSDESWSEGNLIRLCIWQDGIDFGYRVNIPNGVEIKADEEYTFILNDFQAPPSQKTYLEYQMLKEGVTYFGEKKHVDITIK